MSKDIENKEFIIAVFELPIFQHLGTTDKADIANLLHSFSVNTKEELSGENKIYFISKGRIEARFPFDKINTYIFNAGETINEIALYNTIYSPNFLIPLEPTEGFYINAEEYKTFETEKRPIAFTILRNFLKNLSRELRRLNDSIINKMGFVTMSAKRGNIFNRESTTLSPETLEKVRILPFFQKFTNEEFQQLLFDMKKWSILSGNILFSEGEQATSCFILVKGKVEVTLNRSGRRVSLAVFEPGSLFGEIALVHLGLRSATCTAYEDIIVLELTRRDFERATHNYSLLAYKLLEAIAQSLIKEYVQAIPQIKKL